jgi:hypothetical protein
MTGRYSRKISIGFPEPSACSAGFHCHAGIIALCVAIKRQDATTEKVQ